MRKHVLQASLAALCLLPAGFAGAAIIPTYEVQGTSPSIGGPANMTYWAAAPNLLTGSTATGTACSYGIGTPAALTDGTVGSIAFWDGTGTVLIALATPSDIKTIRSMSGHNDDRVNQSYTISYTTDASPTLLSTFTPIGTALTTFQHQWSNLGATGSSVRVTFGDGTATVVGGNLVTALKVDFANLAPNTGGNAMYREFEASVPEPASLSVLALGSLGLLARRRRMA